MPKILATERNLRYMRAFYLNFPIRHAARSESIEERRKALPPELSWTHYRILLKVKNPEEKVFYMNECIENQWPTRYLERQKRITTETQHFYIDLVFYNYLLRCFVLIDLKVGKLTHQDIGQMDMYVRIFENELT
jgi:hypothetical protein